MGVLGWMGPGDLSLIREEKTRRGSRATYSGFVWAVIHDENKVTRVWTPGKSACAHPDPQLVIPAKVLMPSSVTTSGPPLSR